MGMTFWRWVCGVSLACGGAALLLVPFPAIGPTPWNPAAPPPLAAQIDTLTRVAGDAREMVRQYRAAQALDRWTAASSGADTTLVRVDRTVPSRVAAYVRAITRSQWDALGLPVSARHAEVFVYVDSTVIPRTGDTASVRRTLEPRRLVDVTFALPGATDGARCVALVRLRGTTPVHLAALRNQSLIGVCGFYGAFGSPGTRLANWLAATHYRFARRSDWSVARAQATDESSVYLLNEPASRCLTGTSTACMAALGLETPSQLTGGTPVRRLASVLDVGPSGRASSIRPLGDSEDELFADAVRSLGAARFARFWRSGEDPAASFRGAFGTGLEAWTQDWLSRTYGGAPPHPYPTSSNVLWLVLAIPPALLLAARPRERVLAERFLPGRG